MKIYEFKGCQFSENSIKNKSYSQLKEFGVTKEEFDKLVKDGAIIVPKIEKKKTISVPKKVSDKEK